MHVDDQTIGSYSCNILDDEFVLSCRCVLQPFIPGKRMNMGLQISSDMLDQEDKGERVEGRIKWFDPVKGFGFVVPLHALDTNDALLHISILKTFGVETAAEGMKIDCVIARRERGLQVIEILALDQGETEPPPADSPMEPVVVKWFNGTKGDGFVQLPNDEEDIFLHVVTIRRLGLEEVIPGQTFLASIAKGPKGRHVADLKPAE